MSSLTRVEALEEAQPDSVQDPRGFAEEHAEKLLLSAFLVSGILRISAMNAGALGVALFADGLFILVAVVAGSGYLAHHRRRKRHESKTAHPRYRA